MTPTNVENYTLDGLANGTAGDTLSYASTAGSVLVNLATGSATGFTSIAGIENVTGGSVVDTLTGDTGNNRLDGGALNDALAGGAGDDTYIVDHAGDAVTEAADQGTDTVQSSVTHTLTANVENLTLTGGDSISGFGNDSRQHHHRQQRRKHPRRRHRRRHHDRRRWQRYLRRRQCRRRGDRGRRPRHRHRHGAIVDQLHDSAPMSRT